MIAVNYQFPSSDRRFRGLGSYQTPLVGVDLLTGLYAVYQFESGTTTFVPSFGSVDNLTASPATTVSAGKLGNAINLAVAGSLANSVATNFVFSSGIFTISLWIKLNALPAALYNFASKTNGTTNGYQLRVSNTGAVTFFVGNGASMDSVVSLTNISATSWFQVICGRDGSSIYIQVNSEGSFNSINSAASSAFSSNNATVLGIPAGADVAHQLDEVDMWDGRFLGNSERLALWNSGAGKAYPF